MTQLTKNQETKRNQYFARMVERGELTKEDIARIMADPIKRSAINAVCALSK